MVVFAVGLLNLLCLLSIRLRKSSRLLLFFDGLEKVTKSVTWPVLWFL